MRNPKDRILCYISDIVIDYYNPIFIEAEFGGDYDLNNLYKILQPWFSGEQDNIYDLEEYIDERATEHDDNSQEEYENAFQDMMSSVREIAGIYFNDDAYLNTARGLAHMVLDKQTLKQDKVDFHYWSQRLFYGINAEIDGMGRPIPTRDDISSRSMRSIEKMGLIPFIEDIMNNPDYQNNPKKQKERMLLEIEQYKEIGKADFGKSLIESEEAFVKLEALKKMAEDKTTTNDLNLSQEHEQLIDSSLVEAEMNKLNINGSPNYTNRQKTSFVARINATNNSSLATTPIKGHRSSPSQASLDSSGSDNSNEINKIKSVKFSETEETRIIKNNPTKKMRREETYSKEWIEEQKQEMRTNKGGQYRS